LYSPVEDEAERMEKEKTSISQGGKESRTSTNCGEAIQDQAREDTGTVSELPLRQHSARGF